MQGGVALHEARSNDGMARLSRNAFQDALLALVHPWLSSDRMPVIACGMVGARQGWVEAPYSAVPCAPIAGQPVQVPETDPRLAVFVVPGLKQTTPADVMRGEETQIAGFIAQNLKWDGVICMPGTHTKWVHISAGELVSFRTFMTGELFELLSAHSVLQHSLSETGWDEAAFSLAVEETMGRPEAMASKLFGLRAQDLLESVPGETARARLSGALIGAELAAARPYWLGQNVAIIGNSEMAKSYAKALNSLAVPAQIHKADEMVRAGLNAARAKIGVIA